jgi:hypothetical protein
MFISLRRLLASPLVKYNEILERKPLLTKAITSGIMYGAGDIIAQYVENMPSDAKKAEEDNSTARKDFVDVYDYKRTVIFLTFGTVIGGPAFHYWYNYLNKVPHMVGKLLKLKQSHKVLDSFVYLKSFGAVQRVALPLKPSSDKVNMLIKLVADQLVFASGYLFLFFMSVKTAAGTVKRVQLLGSEEMAFYIKEGVEINTATSPSNTCASSGTCTAAGTGTTSYTSFTESITEWLWLQYDVFCAKTEAIHYPSGGVLSADERDSTAQQQQQLVPHPQSQLQSQTISQSTEEGCGVLSTPPAEPSVQQAPTGVAGITSVSGIGYTFSAKSPHHPLAVVKQQVLEAQRKEEFLRTKELTAGQIVRTAFDETKRVFFHTYMIDCMFWPPLQLINFAYVPVQYQFLYVNLFSILWNTYLSLMANKKKG